MNHKAKIIPNIVLPGILTISGVAGIIAIATATTTSALTYSSDTDVSFTFNPTLSISLSNANINIDNLLPGLSSESSPITVHVNSNTPYGYSLFASVGNSTDYNTTSLVHKSNDNSNNNSSNDNNNSNNNSIPSTFTSIATNASLPQLDTDNTWGYSFSNDNGSTWSNYNGLPLYSTVGNNTSINNPALLIDTKSPADSTESIDFKIAAKASSTQASGTYNNVINFYAVGKPYTPPSINDFTYMQDFATLSEADKQALLTATPIEQIYTLKDKRDEQNYTVAKLKDNKIWMTKNLNLAGGTEITSELSNVPDGYTLPTANGFQSGNKLPASSTSGFNDDAKAFVYNSTKTSGTGCSAPGCYSYYSWTAATAGSGLSITADNIDAPYSICPKGWKLPSTRSTSVADWKTESDFYKLAVAYGMNPSSTSQSTANFYKQAGPGTTPNFLPTGYYNGGLYYSSNYGLYWSSTSLRSTSARGFYFNPSYVNSANSDGRRRGDAVRCIAE